MDKEDNKDGTQNQSQRKQTTDETTSASRNRPQLMTKTTRPAKKLEETIISDIITREKYAHCDCKKHQSDSLERELEATMTPTTTADTQPRETQDKSRKRSRNLLTETTHYTSKRSCARGETNDEDETFQQRQQTAKTNESTDEEQGQRRRHTVCGDIGLQEYSPKPKNGNADSNTANAR